METKALILVTLLALAYILIGTLATCAAITRLPVEAWEEKSEDSTTALLLAVFAAWPVVGVACIITYIIDWLRK